ncbi:MAG: S8 family serine peptidase [Candidatus Bathyarchaeia archaeon]|jgi:subtilisin family serine protease|nr:S8 family serine peptidase [Candidatus Bathyarchaeota archaeon A05DMB-4]MDH7594924.1 S8 family serine peptidase [Candidatus Bathyarchaeota archaeon]
MNYKIVTTILLIVLLTNTTITFLNLTQVFASVSRNADSISEELLKGVDFSKNPLVNTDASQNKPIDLLNFSHANQNANFFTYGSDSAELIVGLSDAWGSYEKVEQLVLAKNGRIVNKIFLGNKVGAVVVDVPQEFRVAFMTEVKESGVGRYVEPNLQYQAFMVPNDTFWNRQWGPVKIQADYAWNITVGNSAVLVAVVDTGVDYNHPDLAANYVPLGYDWVNGDSDPMDDHGHGTHVAGIISAVINNAQGIAGLAQVRIMAEKGLDSGGGYYDDLANAIIHATDQGANIISMSWGGSSASSVLHDALKYAYDHNVLLVAAAGNAGSSTRLYPAAFDEVIAVTATDQNDKPASFTSYGDWVELGAPGVQIFSTISYTHYPGLNYPYDQLSGTSMACPHVSGVAALVWSKFPNMSRDVLRFHLRDTADDLGAAGFDVYYGYGRLNAYKAITQPLPPHDLVVTSWKRPPYVEPNSTGTINATIVNYGRSNETATVQLLVNGTLEESLTIDNLVSGTSTRVSMSWSPTIIGNYNVTVYVLPVTNETSTANNVVQGFVYVDFPLKVFVLRSAGTRLVTDAWESLNYNWKQFGDRLINIDYTTLDKDNITYNDLNATGADVLIISCAYAWEYSDKEIEAIKRYVHEGHGFIITAGTFYYQVPNNNKFGSIIGINQSISWGVTATDLLELQNSSHPVFAGVPSPYTMPLIQTSVPFDGEWSSNELAGGTYIALGHYKESAIIVYRGLVFISPWLEIIPEHYYYNYQILYNAMVWSQYQKPEHELSVSLEAPNVLFPGGTIWLNATVRNDGLQNESDIDLYLSVYDMTRNETKLFISKHISSLPAGSSSTLSNPWNPTQEGLYNVTAYSPPIIGEEFTVNNKAAVLVTVAAPLITPQEGQWANYSAYTVDSFGQQVSMGKMQLNYSKYISSYQINVTLLSMLYGAGYSVDWTVVNIVSRLCESGVWQSLWFPGMIETNVTLGSTVNVLLGPATVIGSETLMVGRKAMDTWKLYQNYTTIEYMWWFEKATGLWVRYEGFGGSFHQIIMLDETNIPAGYVPEHELNVALEAPTFVPINGSTLLSATVSNFGLSNETDVLLTLEINETVVASIPIAELAVNASHSISLMWTPSVEATYNVTAYAPPVAGETITSDNLVTVMVKVFAVKGYVLFDQTHGTDSVYSYSQWVSTIQTMGYIVDLHVAGSITSSVLAGYDAFVILQSRTDYTGAELDAIRAFVANGGGLLVIGDDYPSLYTNLTYFGGIAWAGGGMPGFTSYIVAHEVTQGVSQVYLGDPEALLSLSGSASAIVRDEYMEIMLGVNWVEKGRVLGFVDDDALRDYGIGMADNLRLATNMIVWICKEDVTSPQITSVSPSNGTVIGTTSVQMQWVATDSQSGVIKYSVYLNNQFVANTTLASYVLSNLIQGPNNVTIVAYDKAGNYANRQTTIIVDLASPTVEILSPANNSYVRQVVPINISGADDHFDYMDLFIDENKVATFPAGVHTYLWNTTMELYATHQITLIGYDTVGNNASVTITVVVDNILPTVNIASPANNPYVAGNITFVFVAQDFVLKNASIKIIKIGDSVTFDVTGKTSHPFNTATLTDGNYIVKLIAYDLAENRAETQIAVTIDNTLPTAQITLPTANAYVKGLVNATFTFEDSNLEKASLTVAGETFDVTATTFHPWNTTSLSDGQYTITLTVLDKAGNKKTHEISVTVDNTPPVGEIRAPLNGAYVKGLVNITFYVYDANLNVTKLYIDSAAVPPYTWYTSGTHSRLWNTTSADATYTLRLEIYDKAGNQLITTATVHTDNTLPTVTINSPQSNASLSGVIIINFSVTDANLADVILFIDDAPYTVGGQTFYQWDTTKLVDGDHTIRIVATDWAGNTKEAAIKVKTSNALPPYVWPTVTAVLGLAVGALLVWLLLKKKLASTAYSTATSSATSA